MKFLKRLINIVVAGAVSCFLFFGAGNANARAEAPIASSEEETPPSGDEVIIPKKTLKDWWLERDDDSARKELEAQINAGVFEKDTWQGVPRGESFASLVYGRKLTRGKNAGSTTKPLLGDLGMEPKVQFKALQLLNDCSSLREGQDVVYIKPKQSPPNLSDGESFDFSDSEENEPKSIPVEQEIANLARNLLDGRLDRLPKGEQEKIEAAHGAVDIVFELMTVVERQLEDIKGLETTLLAKEAHVVASQDRATQGDIIQKAQLFLQGQEGFIGSMTRYWLPSGLLFFLLGILLCYWLAKSFLRSRELKRDLDTKRSEVGDLRAILGATLQDWQGKFLAQSKQIESQNKALKDLEMRVRDLLDGIKHVPTQTSELLLAALMKNGGKSQNSFRPSIAAQTAEAVVAETLLEASSPTPSSVSPSGGQEKKGTIQVVRFDGVAWDLPVLNLQEDGKCTFKCPVCGWFAENTKPQKIEAHWFSGQTGQPSCCQQEAPTFSNVGVEKTISITDEDGEELLYTYRTLPDGKCKTQCPFCEEIITALGDKAIEYALRHHQKKCSLDPEMEGTQAGNTLQPSMSMKDA